MDDRRARRRAAHAPAVTGVTRGHAGATIPTSCSTRGADPGGVAVRRARRRGRAATSTGSRCCATRVQRARRRVGAPPLVGPVGAAGRACSRSTSPSRSSSSRCRTVAGEFHTSITVLTWTMIGPLLAYGLAAPLFGKVGDVFGHRRLYLRRASSARWSRRCSPRSRRTSGMLLARAHPRRHPGCGDRHRVGGADHRWPSRPRSGSRPWAGGRSWAPAARCIGVSLGSPIIAVFGWRALFWIQLGLLVARACRRGGRRCRARGRAPRSAQRACARSASMDWVGQLVAVARR